MLKRKIELICDLEIQIKSTHQSDSRVAAGTDSILNGEQTWSLPEQQPAQKRTEEETRRQDNFPHMKSINIFTNKSG